MRKYLTDEEIYLVLTGDENSILLMLNLYDKYINHLCKKGYNYIDTVGYYIDEDKKSAIIIGILEALKRFKIR